MSGAMQDSFPHALELEQTRLQRLRAHLPAGRTDRLRGLWRGPSALSSPTLTRLGVSTDCYSLWGGSAGARMAAWLGSYGPAAFGGDDLPRPGAVVMQYTGHSDYTPERPAHLCLRRRQRLDSQLAGHAEAHTEPGRSWTSPPSFTAIPGWATASVLATAPSPRGGWMRPWRSGRRRCSAAGMRFMLTLYLIALAPLRHMMILTQEELQ